MLPITPAVHPCDAFVSESVGSERSLSLRGISADGERRLRAPHHRCGARVWYTTVPTPRDDPSRDDVHHLAMKLPGSPEPSGADGLSLWGARSLGSRELALRPCARCADLGVHIKV